jgi:hypothetical protein
MKAYLLAPVLFGGIPYDLRDDFTDTLAAGNVNGTPCKPGPGTRTVVDTGNLLYLANGYCNFSRNANYDPGVWLDGVARAAGQLMVCHMNWSALNNRTQLGWDTNQSGQAAGEWLRSLALDLRAGTPTIGITLTTTRDYYFAIVLRAAGAYYFIKEENEFPNWTMIFITESDNSTPLYPMVGAHNLWSAGENVSTLLRKPTRTWLPTPLMYHTFTADNGTSLDAATSDTTGPDGQVINAGEAATEQAGDWDIQSNRANPDGAGIATWDVGNANVMIDCVVNGGAAGNPGIVLRYTDADNYWYVQADRVNDLIEIHEVNASVDTVRDSVAAVIADSTDYTLSAAAFGATIRGWIDKASPVSYTSAILNQGVTVHGLFADDSACQFDNFLVYARS